MPINLWGGLPSVIVDSITYNSLKGKIMKKARHIIIMAIVLAFASVAYAGYRFTKQQSDFFKAYATKISERAEYNKDFTGGEFIRIAARTHNEQYQFVLKYFSKYPQYLSMAITLVADSGVLKLEEEHWITLKEELKLLQETFAEKHAELVNAYVKYHEINTTDVTKRALELLYNELFGTTEISKQRNNAIRLYLDLRQMTMKRAGISGEEFYTLFMENVNLLIAKFSDKGMPEDAVPPALKS